MDQSIRQEIVGKDAHIENLGSRNRCKGGICAKEGEGISIVKGRREEAHEFIQEQLRKEYIKPLKSPQMAPVFFVGKKDGKKRMVQDYRYLNEWTIKNNYPLPLILDVVENIGMRKVFIKNGLEMGL